MAAEMLYQTKRKIAEMAEDGGGDFCRLERESKMAEMLYPKKRKMAEMPEGGDFYRLERESEMAEMLCQKMAEVGGGDFYRLERESEVAEMLYQKKGKRAEMAEVGGGDICRLPEGCVSHVLSLTTPRDSCRSAAVSSTFRSAAASDTVWERFLPSDHPSILARAVEPIAYSSKKELYIRLCDAILIDGGKMSFALERSSGATCYMLSARQLGIIWADTPRYWSWISRTDSRFSEVAELLSVCWLDIHGTIESRMLSPRTNYAAYLIFKLADRAYGLTSPLQETLVHLGAHVSRHTVCLKPDKARAEGAAVHARAPRARNDGWMEMEMGNFYNDKGEDGEVEMSLKEVKGLNWKKGLIIQGIEIRPKK